MTIGFGKNAIAKPSLRKWQKDAQTKCLAQFASGKRVWVQETVTGGGKTFFAEDTATRMYQDKVIDLVLYIFKTLNFQDFLAQVSLRDEVRD